MTFPPPLMLMRRSGITLIELLVVVVLVAILAGVALPNYSKMVEKAKVRDAETTLTMIFQAQRIHRLDRGSYGTVIPIGAESPGTLVSRGYLPNPKPNVNWVFAAGTPPGAPADTFAAVSVRTGGGVYNKNRTIRLDQNFTGAPNPKPPYKGKTYFGDHPLRD